MSSNPHGVRRHVAALDSGDMSPIIESADMSAHSKFPTRRLKFVAPLRIERGDMSSADPSYIGMDRIESWTGCLIEVPNNSDIADDKSSPESTTNRFKKGDVLFGKLRPYLAKVWLANQDGCGTTEFLVLNPGDMCDAAYLRYLMLRPSFITDVEASTFGAKMPRANWDFIGGIHIPIPPISTQQRIATYLDRETARIDALVAEKERMLDLLEQKRTALISRAVTRGLSPKAPTKPSGVDWFGEIPAHWKVMRLKHLFSVGNGSTPNVENADYWTTDLSSGFPWLNSSVVNDFFVVEASRFVTHLALSECHLPKIDPPAVLVGITGQGKTRGMSAILRITATINQHVAYLKPTGLLCECEFLQYQLQSAYKYLRSNSDGAGSTKGAITCEQLANFPIPVPPLAEQEAIIAHIRVHQTRAAALESALRDSIALLKERRSALITAAVTGKLAISA